jgi:thioredoxin 1
MRQLSIALFACVMWFAALPAIAADVPGIINVKNAKEFDAFIAQNKDAKGLIVVDFHAEWCGPCKRLGPDLEALVKANPGKLAVLKVDIDHNPELATRFSVESIPLVVKIFGGKEIARTVGYTGKAALEQWLALK